MNELLYYDLKAVSGLTPSLATQVSREIGRRVVAGYLPEGELIEDENKLCERYSVSKPVIREAVKLLVAKGMLKVRRGDGTRVQPRVKWSLLDDDVLAWHQGTEPNPDFLRQLVDVRQIIEPSAASWAAINASTEQINDIYQAQQKMDCSKTTEEFVIADALFHRSILRASNNEILIGMEGLIFSALLSSIKITNNNPFDNRQRSLPLHHEILEAIESRNSDRAHLAMHKHMADTHKRLSEILPGFKMEARKAG